VVGRTWLETKTDKGRLSEAQRLMHARITAAGERVAVVRSVAEALEAIRS
jgi:hypothetical protein